MSAVALYREAVLPPPRWLRALEVVGCAGPAGALLWLIPARLGADLPLGFPVFATAVWIMLWHLHTLSERARSFE